MLLQKVMSFHLVDGVDCNTPDHRSAKHPAKSSTSPFHITRWLRFIHDGHNVQNFRIVESKPYEIDMLKALTNVGVIRGELPAGVMEELRGRGIFRRITNAIDQIGGAVFARWDECSPKDGKLKLGPLRTAEDVVLQICTSKRTLYAIAATEKKCAAEKTALKCPLVLTKYIWSMHAVYEFRCFVYRDRLTAISQYAWKTYMINWTTAATTIWGMAEDMKRRIVKYNDQLDDDYSDMLNAEGFIFDIRVKGESHIHDVQLISLNAFGPNSNCGSALFHWTKDWKVLSGESGSQREMRIVEHPNEEVSANMTNKTKQVLSIINDC